MRPTIKTAAILAAAGLCAPAFAQDSVSTNLGDLPGDALNPFADQCAEYVVDLAPIMTSKGTVFGIAPIVKSTKAQADFFNNLWSAQSISPDLLTGVQYPSASYAIWENTPGAGVNAQNNSAAGTTTPNGTSSQFAVALDEFGGTEYNGIVGAVVNYDPANPNRLFVTRRMAAVNAAGNVDASVSQLGGVTLDANGNVYYRADNFGASGDTGFTTIAGQNIFRTRLLDRACGVSNIISGDLSTSDATDAILFNSPTTHSVPSNMPASVAGGNGLYGGANFNTEYAYGDTGSVTGTTSHLDTTGGLGSDHRGTMGSTAFDFTGSGAAWTYGILSKDPAGDTSAMNAFGVDASGAVVGSKGLLFPISITDNDDGKVTSMAAAESVHHNSQTAFRGGVGQVAVAGDQNGLGLMAATFSQFAFNDDPANIIAVVRYNATTGTEEWTSAAYTDITNNTGKAICDETGAAIGQLVPLGQVTGGSPFGPSLSSPAFDSVGNVWFLGSVELFNRIDTDDDGIGDTSDFDGALLRAIYDPNNFSYQIELVLELGTQVTGLNSGVDYRINFLGTADSDSVSSGTMFSSNVSDTAWNNTSTAGLETSDPMTNGGVFLGTEIVYDTNGDGFFNDPTSANFDAGEPADEAYSVGLYVGYYADEQPPVCAVDLDMNGTLDFFDLSIFLNNQIDWDGNTVFDFFDLSGYLAEFGMGCP